VSSFRGPDVDAIAFLEFMASLSTRNAPSFVVSTTTESYEGAGRDEAGVYCGGGSTGPVLWVQINDCV